MESTSIAPSERLLDLLAHRDPLAPCLVTAETGARLTYDELSRLTESLAGRLATLGVGRGSRVAIVVPNGPDFVQLLLAIISLGAVAAPLNPAYTRDEYTFYLDDLQPELLVVPAGELPAAREAAGSGVTVVDVTRDDAGLALAVDGKVIVTATPYEEAHADDIALLLHTSGTTSRPKQVPLRQRNLTSSARTIAAFYELKHGEVSYCAMPLFHVHGLVASTFSVFASGGIVVVPQRLAPRAFWSQLREHNVAWYSAGPTLHQMLLDRIDAEGAPPSLRFTRACSSALSPALMRRVEETLGVPILEAYGMTEASHQMASNPLPPGSRKPGSVGLATGVEIRIADPRGAFLDPGASGEVVIKGPAVTDGYLNNESANAESFFDGWFRTGDRGSIDEEGYLRLEGRLKEMILRGGENISPYEIEEILLGHPAVTDAICFGIDDEKYGERVGAAVALREPAEERELIDFCRTRLAAFKVPDVVHVLDAIPRTPTGKVQRKRVGESLTASTL